jgi:pimeloyl-ACP methyl ester carboxylesterase
VLQVGCRSARRSQARVYRAGMKRWLRRIAIALVVLAAALTIASFAYNAVSGGRERPASQLYPGPFVEADGTLIAYRRWGGAGSPIVLLGGFVEPSWVWRQVGALLGRRHRVYAIDLPPFGYTQRRGPYTLAHWVELVRSFDARLGVRRPLLVGHSLGAAVAVRAALEQPQELAGIVLLDGDALPVGGGVRWLSKLVVNPYYTSLYRIVTGSDWIVRRALRGALGPGVRAPGPAELDDWQRPFRVSGTAAAFRELFSYGIQGVSLDELRHVRVPRLVAWGAADTVDPIAAGRKSAQALDAPFILIPHAGHLSMLGNPGAVAAAIERAAASTTKPARSRN